MAWRHGSQKRREWFSNWGEGSDLATREREKSGPDSERFHKQGPHQRKTRAGCGRKRSWDHDKELISDPIKYSNSLVKYSNSLDSSHAGGLSRSVRFSRRLIGGGVGRPRGWIMMAKQEGAAATP